MFKRKSTFLSSLVFLFCSLSVSVFAGDVDKAFKALNTGDYPNAYKFLKEVISEDPENAAANYGLATYFLAKDNSAYNIDSANYYIRKSVTKLPINPDDKAGKKFLTLGVRDYTISALQTDVNRAGYQRAEKENTAEAYQFFIDNFSDKGMIHRATLMRNQLAYISARAKNSPQALQDFISRYPEADEAAEAKELYDKLLYEQTTSAGTYEAYKTYMDKYPEGTFYGKAKTEYDKLLIEHYNKEHSIAGYKEFLKKYSNHPYAGSIKDSLYVLSTADGSIASYKNYLQQNPDSPHLNEAWDKLYTLYTAPATDSIYLLFKDEFPAYPNQERLRKDSELSAIDLKPFPMNGLYGYAYQPTADSLTLAIPAEYEEAYSFSNGCAAVRLNPCTEAQCTYFYIDKSNRKLFNRDFNYAGDFVKGFAVVGLGNCESGNCKYGIIDRSGNWVAPAEYDELNDASEGLYLALKGDHYGFLNNKGETTITFKYSDALDFSEGLAAVALGEKWFFIDRTGNQAFIRSFADVSSFADSLCAFTDDNKLWGYIDHNGNTVIEPKYDAADDFEGGYGIVSKKEKDPKNKGLFITVRYKIDKTGKELEKLTAAKPTSKSKSRKKSKR